MAEIIVPTSLFITMAIVFSIFIISRHREKMYAMERGMTPEMINAVFQRDKSKQKDKYSTLKWGMMFFFTGVGFVLVGYFDTMDRHISDEFKFSIIAISIGLALLITYFVIDKKNEQQKIIPPTQANESNSSVS
ncbi:MAG: hypothetical protein FJ218_06265 [Ignavibacteria bacterium]|nr:hypothetical protein [Ignavibacteria bacterium]